MEGIANKSLNPGYSRLVSKDDHGPVIEALREPVIRRITAWTGGFDMQSIPEELPVQQQRIYDVLDGRIPSTDAQNEAYAALLVGACNHLSKTLRFLFEKIDDYAELLLPDDLISQFSILQRS